MKNCVDILTVICTYSECYYHILFQIHFKIANQYANFCSGRCTLQHYWPRHHQYQNLAVCFTRTPFGNNIVHGLWTLGILKLVHHVIAKFLVSHKYLLFQDGCSSVEDQLDNFDSLQSEELLSVASVIDKLSVNAATDTVSEEEPCDNVRDITHQAIRQTVEENEDLKRQNILLEQQLEEKERRIKALEKILVTENRSCSLSNGNKSLLVNSASQVVHQIITHIFKYITGCSQFS